MTKWIVPNVIALLIFAFLVLLLKDKPMLYEGTFLVDAFVITGFFIWLGAGIVFIDQEGVFDIAIYGLKRFVRLFKKSVDDDFPDSYYDYSEGRKSRKRVTLYPTLIVGTVYVLVGIIIYLVQ